jgi:hypothetical protein
MQAHKKTHDTRAILEIAEREILNVTGSPLTFAAALALALPVCIPGYAGVCRKATSRR